MEHISLTEVLAASRKWIEHFNKGDTDFCVAGYAPDAVMIATPMGTFEGTKAIDEFWRPFMASGAKDLVYTDIWLKVIDRNKIHLGANWKMNVGRGIITLEEWVKQSDNRWILAKDEFEIQEQF